MRIPNANITTQAVRIPSSPHSSPAAKSLKRGQLLAPQNGYNRDGRQDAAQVIDAEYVDFYTPSTQVFNQERRKLDISLAAGATQGKTEPNPQPSSNPAIGSYQAAKNEPPPLPGTYINIYA